MRELICLTVMLGAAIATPAQTTPEEIMELLPKMPTEAEMVRYHKEITAPVYDDKAITQPDLYNDFFEALKKVRAQVDEEASQLGDASVAKTMKSKVAGTDYTVEEIENMSEAEQEKMAMAMAQKKLAGMGISLSDLPKDGEELSDAQAQALAAKVMANKKSGGQLQADAKRTELIMKLSELNSEEGRLVLTIDDPLKAAAENGRKLYEREYKPKIEALEAQQQALLAQGYALSEKFSEEDRPRVEADNKKFHDLTVQIWEQECDFHSKYIPSWRKAVLASMDFCKNTLVPIEKQRQDLTDQLYELTQDVNYTMGDTYPITGAIAYLEQSEKLGAYDDYLNPPEEE